MTNKHKTIVVGGGCFWCLEAFFLRMKGIVSVVSGYAGGSVPNPTYDRVCSGNTGHAEVVRVTYDESVIGLEDVLRIFFAVHDPTTPNRQGNDAGTQYRSIVLYADDAERETIARVIEALESENAFDDPIVTQVSALETFYPAEEYHQRYFEKNPSNAYCQAVISPKLQKLRQSLKAYYRSE